MLIKILTIALLAGSIVAPAFAQAQTKPFVKEQKLTFHPPLICRKDCTFLNKPNNLEIYQFPLFQTNSEWLLENTVLTTSFSTSKAEVILRE